MRLQCLFAALCALGLVEGCAYSTVGRVYDGDESDQIRLSQLRPRKPLRASIVYEKAQDSLSSEDNRHHTDDGLPAVTKRLEDSGYFEPIRQSPSADDDVRIVFGGTWCTRYKADGPGRVLIGVVTLPLLLPVPNKEAENHCDLRFTYSLRDAGEAATENAVSYGYARNDYTATPWWKWAYTGESRQERQWDYLFDQSVAKLLNAMIGDWNQRVAARSKKGGSN